MIETPKMIKKEISKIAELNKYDINLENKLYKLELGKSEDKKSIIFKAYEDMNNLNKKYFFLELDIDKFYNLNIIFKLYQSIDEIYSLLKEIIINKKYTANQNKNNFILILQFSMPGGKNIEINFNLIENKIEKEDLIENLYSVVTQLLKENKLIKEENKIIKERLKNIEEYIDKKKEKEKEKEKNVFDLDKSYIIKDKEKKISLKNWITENGKIKNINLLYRATLDGDSCKSFFNKCGKKGATVSLIKTKKNRIFGGFTNAEWSDKEGVKRLYDNKAFLFSLDNMQKYKILKPEVAIGCYPNENCLVYGNNADSAGVYLSRNFLNRKDSTENHKTRVYNVPSDYCLTGENNFEVEEVEVYQVIFV